jgi:hypothetical protein
VQQRTLYRVAGESLLVETRDEWAAAAIDTLFAGWYLTPDAAVDADPSVPGLVMSSDVRPAPIPRGLDGFEVAGGGTCYTDGDTSYVDIDGSIVTIGSPDAGAIEVRMDGPVPFEAPALTRVVTYALSAALRRRRRFELHSAAAVDPQTGKGILIVGPSGSGKSTMSVNLASAGWPFLTDDVLLLSRASADVEAWPLRRCFAVLPDDAAAEKRLFLPHERFGAPFRDRCVPATLLFPALTGEGRSEVSPLSAGEAMTRLIRMSPWCCYDRTTAADHLAVLSALARQATAYAVRAGTDLLDPHASVNLVAACARES